MPRVLVVDDSAAVRRTLVHAVRRLGYQVEEASSGELALEAVARAAPDLVVTDYQMREMDGVELFHELRKLPRDRSPAVLFVSGGAIQEVRARVGPAERVSFLSKPFLLEVLEEELRALLHPRGSGGSARTPRDTAA